MRSQSALKNTTWSQFSEPYYGASHNRIGVWHVKPIDTSYLENLIIVFNSIITRSRLQIHIQRHVVNEQAVIVPAEVHTPVLNINNEAVTDAHYRAAVRSFATLSLYLLVRQGSAK